jgi:hypothetical protein
MIILYSELLICLILIDLYKEELSLGITKIPGVRAHQVIREVDAEKILTVIFCTTRIL